MLFRAALFLFALLCFHPAQAERKVALLIGNAAYSAPATELRNPPNDIAAIGAMLTGADFDVTVVTNVGRSAMSAALAGFEEKARGADVGLIYYSGHGMEIGGTNYLLPVDVKLASDRDVKYEAIALDDLLVAMDGVRTLKLVLLDACRDNPFLTAMKRLATKGIPSRGLARVETAESNLLVGYATAPGDVALDGEGDNSPYASALVRHLVEPGVEVETALRAVAKDVFEATGGKQRPFKTGSLFETVMLGPLSATVAPVTKGDVSVDPCRDATAHWTEIKTRKDKALFEEHVKLFGSCAFASLARQEIATLEAASRVPEENDCDRLAAVANDPFKLATVTGVEFDRLDGRAAVEACKAARAAFPTEPRFFYQYGRALDRTGSYVEAMAEYKKAAEAGSTLAMRNIGILYDNGEGVDKNPKEAMIWFRKAADLGNAASMNSIGYMYESGSGVKADMGEALVWYRKAADGGNAVAMTNLGYAYETAKGVKRNYTEAMGWYVKAADLGNAQAMNNIGVLYEKGQGISQNYKEAMSWYQKAAENNNGYAVNNIAALLDNGRVGPADRREAARHMENALRLGHDYALKQMKENTAAWSVEFRKELQQRLKDAGVYNGTIDGRFGRSTIASIEAIFGKPAN
ncbi:caspase family protein [Rhizobium sp. LjRoot30]|uniref:caspase family protein n=1 Tax=Rhizobium sp. LjRoot30 TaxID=3342320 RepID=UPI003ECFD982